MAGATQEDKGVLRHLGVLHRQTLRIAVRVMAAYGVDDAGGRLGGGLAHLGAIRLNRRVESIL